MKIQEVLKKHNKKVTPERILLAEWMKQKHLFSANDILREFSEVSRASVFRTLKLFSDIGYLRALNI
jgi:Fe2+ or Zn2+ uptake regulation protein